MFDTTFGEVSFDTGWYKNESIMYCGKQYEIYVCAKSYRETDLITDSQRTAYKAFIETKSKIENEIENMLALYKNKSFLDYLQPTGLVFKRDGEYALMFDDNTDLDNGIVVVLSPNREVMTQDDYL